MKLFLVAVVLLVFSGAAICSAQKSCSVLKDEQSSAQEIYSYSLRNLPVEGCGIFLSSTVADVADILKKVYKDDGLTVAILPDYLGDDDFCDSYVSPVKHQVFILRPVKRDRTCLVKPEVGILDKIKQRLTIAEFDYSLSIQDLAAKIVDRVNAECNLFRELNGDLSPRGRRRSAILKNLYSPDSPQKCDTIESPTMLTASIFLRDFVFRSRPVIIRNFANNWPAKSKWNLEFFSGRVGSKRVHVKLSPTSNYEGVEPHSIWKENDKSKKIPDAVLNNLKFPDLVVVRPASADLTMNQLIGVIRSISSRKLVNASAYLEYTPLESVDQSLVGDVPLPSFVDDLKLDTTNLWLSDGRTVGKLHFDGADNILVQLVGVKNLTIFDPLHNENLYEGHIQEAELTAHFKLDKNGNSLEPWSFSRTQLMDSTSMVMSPVDLDNIDFERFPNFARAVPMVCTLEAGDALFMPAFWWHEVHSHPDAVRQFNLAVNFWFRSFFVKDIPCPECQIDINSDYYHLLDTYS